MPVMCEKKQRKKQTLDDEFNRDFQIAADFCVTSRRPQPSIQNMLGVFLELIFSVATNQAVNKLPM